MDGQGQSERTNMMDKGNLNGQTYGQGQSERTNGWTRAIQYTNPFWKVGVY